MEVNDSKKNESVTASYISNYILIAYLGIMSMNPVMRGVSLTFIKNMFKMQLEHNCLWLMYNNIPNLSEPLWRIVVEYWSEDPRIINIICQDQEENFTTTGELDRDGQMPDRFIIEYDDDYINPSIEINVARGSRNHPRYWYAKNVELFQILLLLPIDQDITNNDGHSNFHVPLIRDYLYWRLANPRFLASSDRSAY
jgi:hypothetical protein